MTVSNNSSDKPRCTARNSSGKPCQAYPIAGGFVCSVHGGRAPQVVAAAKQRLAAAKLQAKANAVLAHEGREPVEDPLQELGKLASASQALAESLGKRVNALSDLEHFGSAYAPQIKAEVALYERALDRTGRLLDILVRHGYSERQIQIQETEAMLVAGVLRRVVSALGLTTEQQNQAQKLLAAEFRSMRPIAAPATGRDDG